MRRGRLGADCCALVSGFKQHSSRRPFRFRAVGRRRAEYLQRIPAHHSPLPGARIAARSCRLLIEGRKPRFFLELSSDWCPCRHVRLPPAKGLRAALSVPAEALTLA
ncbi:hypothetical protein NDU88_004897 [Pleurodeles waltl]|uniref:Uncharacterized protein n=1 Tax=Pleurodeles waltl TaxID=8319 RepID=A0AAV7NKZ9_PLEWA|nr:hypothetical protein NDU88_004897 [Pleurodeles waltl]